jgi:dihydrolipoamide dehydrogenase
MQHARDYGLSADKIGFDAAAVVQRSRSVSGRLNGGVAGLLKKNKVSVIWGEAKISRPGEVIVSKAAKVPMQPQHPEPRGALPPGTYQAKHIIVATGARPRVLPGLEPDGRQVLTYFEAMVPKDMPKSLLVVGSGAIGIEFASFYHAMGVDVTVVEIVEQIMPVEDAEIARIAQKQFEKRGLKIKTGAKVSALKKSPSGVTATIEQGASKTELTVDRVISAVGVVGNVWVSKPKRAAS